MAAIGFNTLMGGPTGRSTRETQKTASKGNALFENVLTDATKIKAFSFKACVTVNTDKLNLSGEKGTEAVKTPDKSSAIDANTGNRETVQSKGKNVEQTTGEKADNTENLDASAKENVSAKPQEKNVQSTGQDNQTKAVNTDTEGRIIEDKTVEETVLELLASIIQSFSEILEVTPKELASQLESFEISYTELTCTGGIAKLMTAEGMISEQSDLIFDPKAYEMFEKMSETVNKLMESFGVTQEDISTVDLSDTETLISEISGMLEKQNEYTGRTNEAEAHTLSTHGENAEESMNLPDEAEEDIPVTVTYEKDAGTSSENSEKKEEFEGTQNGHLKPERSSERANGRNVTEKTTVKAGSDGFLAGLNAAVENTQLEAQLKEMGTSIREIVHQIVDAVNVKLSPEKTSLEISLTPDNLGHVKLDVSEKNGTLTARISTENETAKSAIEGQLQILKSAIEAKGVTVEAIEVTVSSFSFSDSANAMGNSGKGKDDREKSKGHIEFDPSGTNVADAVDSELREKEVMRHSGSTVSYVA